MLMGYEKEEAKSEAVWK